MLSDVASVSVDVVSLFGTLETLYATFTKSQRIYVLFEQIQKEAGIKVKSMKRLNTVRIGKSPDYH